MFHLFPDLQDDSGLLRRTRSEVITHDVLNDTRRFEAVLPNLTEDSTYDLRVAAVVKSQVRPGDYYEGPSSVTRRVLVGRQCDPHQAFSKVPHVLEYNAGIIAGVICTAATLVLIVFALLICRYVEHATTSFVGNSLPRACKEKMNLKWLT